MSFRLLAVLYSVFSMVPGLAQQTQTDTYTRYELHEPGSGKFRIIYDVSATTTGAEYYWNTLRKGSAHQVRAVYDRHTGEALSWTVVSGAQARTRGHHTAAEDTEYLEIKLPGPVPQNGETRLRIDKTYTDTKSYYYEGDLIVFNRSLGVRRNAVVLPRGYEVAFCNYPVQVQQESDGRIKVSFMNIGVGSVPFQVKGALLEGGMRSAEVTPGDPWPDYEPSAQGRDKSRARVDYTFTERAAQDREIVYFLQQPETHSFRLYHDYTESRPGVDKYLNVVRAGSKATDPSAFNLDTGEELRVETLRGSEISEKGIALRNVTGTTEVVVIWFDPVREGHTTRLRIWETYTDPHRYLLHGDALIWDRSFGRNRNRVVLPDGWYLTDNAIPAKIQTTSEGLIQLDYMNPRPDNIDVWIKAARR